MPVSISEDMMKPKVIPLPKLEVECFLCDAQEKFSSSKEYEKHYGSLKNQHLQMFVFPTCGEKIMHDPIYFYNKLMEKKNNE